MTRRGKHVFLWILDHPLARMMTAGGGLLLLMWITTGPAVAQVPSFTPRDESPEDYPAGAGREQAFYACTPCHGFKIVAQQGQTRRQWDDTIDWMLQRHNMPRPSDSGRRIVLDYLEAAFPPRTSPGGWRNPFQKQ